MKTSFRAFRRAALGVLVLLLPSLSTAVTFYDFENLDRGPLIGQDGWTNDLSSIGIGVVQPGGGANTSLVLRLTNTTGTTYFRRFNNANYAFTVYQNNETYALYQFDAQWTNVLDNAVYMAPRGTNQIAFSFGINKSNLQLRGASFGTNIATRPIPSSITNGHWVRLRLVADFTSSTNEGSGVLYYKNLTAGDTEFTAWITNNNLEIQSKALTNGAGMPVVWTGIQFQVDGLNFRADNALIGDADLGVGQEANPIPFYLTDQNVITYSVGVTNYGPMSVTNCIVVDEIPTNSTFVSATPSQGSCIYTNGKVICDMGTLGNGNAADVQVVVSNLSNSRVVNFVYTTAAMGDGNPINDSVAITNLIYNSALDLADINISKQGAPDPVIAGTGVVAYTVTVTNNGPPSSAVTLIEDILPPGVTFLPATPTLGLRIHYPFSSNDLVTTDDASNSGHPGTVINALPVTNGFVGDAMLFDGTDDYIEVADSDDLNFTNRQYIMLSARIRPNALATQATLIVKGGTQGATNANYGLKCEGARLSFYYQGDSGTHLHRSTGNVITNAAWAQVGVVYRFGHPSSIRLFVNGVVVPSAWITLNGLEAPIITNEPLWIGATRFIGTNIQDEFNGTMDEVRLYRRGLNTNEVLLLGNTNAPRSDDGWLDMGGGVYGYDAGTVAAGQATSTVIRARVLSSTLGVLTNYVSVSNAQIEINTADNVASDETAVDTFSDLRIFKSDAPDPVIAGTNLVYTLIVTNAGPSDALSCTITDALPSNLVFNAAQSTEGGYFTNGIVTYDLGTRPALFGTSITVHCTVPSSYPSGDIVNVASVYSGTVELDPVNNSTSVPSTVIQRADMRITQTNTPSPVVAGTPLTYVVTVSNAGPSDADSVFMTDNLPLEVLPSDQVFSNLGYMVARSAYSITVQVTVISAASGSITNRVLTSSLTPDPTPANNSNSMATAITRQSDMAIFKTESDDPVLAGDASLTYTILVTNIGPSDAASVIVTDNLPSVVSPSGTYVTNLGSVEAGGYTSFTLTVSVNSSAIGAMTNRASVISANTDPVAGNNVVFEPTAIALQSDLGASKKVMPEVLVAGTGVVTYTVTFTNSGPSDAVGLVATDTMPAGVIYLSPVPTSGLQLYYGFLSNEPTRVTDLSGQNNTGLVFANAAFVSNGVFNGAMQFDGQSDRISVRDLFSAGPNISTGSPFTISAWIKPSSLPALGTIYNKGRSRTSFLPLFANAILRTRNAQLEFYYQSVGTNDNIFRTTGDVLTVGSWSHVALTHLMGTNGYTRLYVNGVEQPASWTTGDGNAQLISSALPPMIGAETEPGGTNIINEFFGSLDEVRFYDRVLPSNEVFRLAIGSTIENDTRCVETNGIVTCDVGALVSGGSTSLVIRAIVPQAVTNQLSNTVSISSFIDDPDPSDDVGYVLHSPTGEADLVVWKTSDSGSVISGQTRTYTVTISNRGPSQATGVLITDNLPPLTTFNPSGSTPGLVASSNQVTYNVGTMPTNSGLAVTIAVTVASANFAAHLTNNAVVSGNQADPDTSNNSTNQVISASRFVVLQVRLNDTPDPVSAGSTVSYAVTVTNLGPSDALTVTVSNVLPSLATFTTNGSSPGLVATTNGRVIATLGQLGAGTATTLTVNAIASSCSTGSGTFQTFTFSDIGSSGSGNTSTKFDLVAPTHGLYDFEQFNVNAALLGTDNWQGIAWNEPMPSANAIIVNTTGVVSKGVRSLPGSNLLWLASRQNDARFAIPTFRSNTTDAVMQYDIQFFATGETTVSIGTVADYTAMEFGMDESLMYIYDANYVDSTTVPIPAGIERGHVIRLRLVVDFTAAGGNGSAILYYLNRTLGETNFTAVCTNANLGLQTFTAGESLPQAPVNPAQLTNLVLYMISESNIVDNVQISEANIGVGLGESTDPAIAGSNVTYTVVVTNIGPMRARDTVATMLMPATAQLGGGSGPGGSAYLDGCMVRLPMGDISAGSVATGSILVSYTVAGTNTNTVCVQSAYYDPNQTNNIARITTVALPGADLSVSKQDSADPAAAGTSLVYTVTITNRGPHTATNVVVTDTLPAGVVPTGVIVTNFGNMASGATTSFTVQVSVPPSFTGVLTNRATVSNTTLEASQANNVVTELTTVIGLADVSIEKYDSSDPVFAGQDQLYTIVVSNAGPSDAINATVVDTLPPGSLPAGPLTNLLGTLTPGYSTSYVLEVTISSLAVGAVTNRAAVSSEASDPDTNDNVAVQVTAIDTLSDLAITKTGSPNPVETNSTLVYTIIVTNAGPSAASSVTVTDALPALVTFQSASGDGAHNAGIVSFGPLLLDAGLSTSLTIQVDVNAGTVGAITNDAEAATLTAEVTLTNNKAQAITAIPDADGDGNPNFGDADDDNDGIPDIWEMLYGLSSTNAADADVDADGDGFSNLREFIADTVPTNGASFHRLTVISNRPTRSITFPSSTGRIYGVEYSTNLLGTTWIPVQTNVPGQAGSITIPITNTEPAFQYRIGVGLP